MDHSPRGSSVPAPCPSLRHQRRERPLQRHESQQRPGQGRTRLDPLGQQHHRVHGDLRKERFGARCHDRGQPQFAGHQRLQRDCILRRQPARRRDEAEAPADLQEAQRVIEEEREQVRLRVRRDAGPGRRREQPRASIRVLVVLVLRAQIGRITDDAIEARDRRIVRFAGEEVAKDDPRRTALTARLQRARSLLGRRRAQLEAPQPCKPLHVRARQHIIRAGEQGPVPARGVEDHWRVALDRQRDEQVSDRGRRIKLPEQDLRSERASRTPHHATAAR